MSTQVEKYPEAFVSPEKSPPEEGCRTVLPPLADLDGRFRISDLMDWFDFMAQVYRHNSIVCAFFRGELPSMSRPHAQRAEACIREIEGMMPVFTRRHPSLFPLQQR